MRPGDPQLTFRNDLNVALAGDSPGFLPSLEAFTGDAARLQGWRLVAVLSPDPGAPGMRAARSMSLFTCSAVKDLLSLQGLDLVIVSAETPGFFDSVVRDAPPSVGVMDMAAARRLLETAFRREPADPLLDRLGDPIFIVGPERRILNANRASIDLFAGSTGRIEGRTCHEILHGRPEPCGADECPLVGLEQGKDRTRYRDYRLTEGGTQRYFEAAFRPLPSPSGERARYLISLRDVTARRGLEHALERSRTRYKHLFDHAREGIALFDPQGRIVEANESLRRMLGYTLGDLLSTPVRRLSVNEGGKILADHLEDLQILGSITVEMEFLHKGGNTIPVETDIIWLMDQDLFLLMVRDITARKRLEASRKLYSEKLEADVAERTLELERREAFVQNLIQNSIDGIIATDPEGTIIIFNRGVSRILGYDSEEVLSRFSYQDILSRETLREVLSAFYGDRFGPPGKLLNMESKLLNRSGEAIPVRLSGTLLYEQDKEVGSVVFVQDLREIQRLQREKEQAERMAAVGKTVAGLAHYIKNILNGLKGGGYVINSAIAKGDLDLTKKGWDMVERNIDQIAAIVLDMLTYSTKREPSYEQVDPNGLADEILSLVEDRARLSNVRLESELTPDLPPVSMDRTGIHRALLNLVANAIDACTLEGIMEGRGVVRVRTDRPAGWGVRFEVRDNGTGMEQDTQERLFRDFYTTKGYKGTGLGLPVTAKVVREHGGELTFESEPGKGTTFTLLLPDR